MSNPLPSLLYEDLRETRDYLQDVAIAESYIYVTAYPEPAESTTLQLPPQAHWQQAGFSAAVLPYAALRDDTEPEKLLRTFALDLFQSTAQLFA
ncbi:MAG: DUF5996 family protein [Candidatus Saccharimonadales bacterium]